MSIPQHIVYGQGGTVSLDIPDLPSTVTIRVFNGDGTVKLNATSATISTINTVLNIACNKGDTVINVTANTGFTVGSKFWIQDDPEEALVRKVAGTLVYLRRPLIYTHIASARIEGSKVQCAINSEIANSLFWDGRVEWNIDGTVQHFTSVDCCKYPLRRLATVQDILDIEPNFYYLVDSTQDIERLLDLGFEEVLKRISTIAPENRVRVFTASAEFAHATALAALMFHYMHQNSLEHKEMFERFQDKLKTEISCLLPVLPRDANQDGIIELDEKISSRCRKIERA